jgi:hypothetical protein
MNGSTVTVIIELSRGGPRVQVTKSLERWVVEDTFAQLDVPDVNASGLSRMLCTHPDIIQRTMKSRNEIAKLLTDELLAALLDAMNAGDTRMGYPR